MSELASEQFNTAAVSRAAERQRGGDRVGGSVELVIFDNDGVLVDSEPIANRVLADLLTEYGDPTSYRQAVDRYMGTNLAYVRDVVEAKLGRSVPDDFENRYHARLFDRMRTELRPVPGVEAALDAIDLPTCVASSGTHERIAVTLRTVGMYARFVGRIYSSEDVERGKPHPDLFCFAAGQLGVRPEHCVVVEDSPHGVTAAKAAGMTVVGYAGMTPAERLADADTVITTMAALPGSIHH